MLINFLTHEKHEKNNIYPKFLLVNKHQLVYKMVTL